MRTLTINERLANLAEEAQDYARDAENSADNAQRSIQRMATLLDELSVTADPSVREAASLGLPAMIDKYGYHSKEVQAVEELLAK